MRRLSYKIDSFNIRLYGNDQKGGRTRWGDKVIRLTSKGKEIGQAVFAREGAKSPEAYCSGDKIYFFAPSSQYSAVVELLRRPEPVYLNWESVNDPKEKDDGDAFFSNEPLAGP